MSQNQKIQVSRNSFNLKNRATHAHPVHSAGNSISDYEFAFFLQGFCFLE